MTPSSPQRDASHEYTSRGHVCLAGFLIENRLWRWPPLSGDVSFVGPGTTYTVGYARNVFHLCWSGSNPTLGGRVIRTAPISEVEGSVVGELEAEVLKTSSDPRFLRPLAGDFDGEDGVGPGSIGPNNEYSTADGWHGSVDPVGGVVEVRAELTDGDDDNGKDGGGAKEEEGVPGRVHSGASDWGRRILSYGFLTFPPRLLSSRGQVYELISLVAS